MSHFNDILEFTGLPHLSFLARGCLETDDCMIALFIALLYVTIMMEGLGLCVCVCAQRRISGISNHP